MTPTEPMAIQHVKNPALSSFCPETALFRNLDVNLRI